MLLEKIYRVIDEAAPFSLSKEFCDTFGGHDNSGIQLDCGKDISRVLFSLDLSAAAVAYAERIGAGCIVTHHPAIFTPLYSLSARSGGQVLECARAEISVLSAHLNLDCAAGGIDESLMRGIGGKEPIAVMQKLSEGAYGRVYDIANEGMDGFVRRLAEVFQTRRTVTYGAGEVRRVASFCGAGLDEEALSFAAKHGADTVVSSDGKHHLIAEAAELGIKLVLLTHYAAEHYGFHQFYQEIAGRLGADSAFFTDERFL